MDVQSVMLNRKPQFDHSEEFIKRDDGSFPPNDDAKVAIRWDELTKPYRTRLI